MQTIRNSSAAPEITNLFQSAKSPEDWCLEINSQLKMRLSPRTLRKLAKEKGRCFFIGRKMMLFPEDIVAIFLEED